MNIKNYCLKIIDLYVEDVAVNIAFVKEANTTVIFVFYANRSYGIIIALVSWFMMKCPTRNSEAIKWCIFS